MSYNKKLFSLIAFVIMFNNMMGQTIKVKGTFNGKPITIEYQEGASGKDYVSKISYKPYDDLQKEKATLEKEKNRLEKRIKELEKEVETLDKEVEKYKKGNGKPPVSNDTTAKRLQKELNDAVQELNTIKKSLNEKTNEIKQLESEISQLRNVLQDSTAVLSKTRDELYRTKKQSSEYAKEIAILKGKKLDNRDNISLQAFFSSSTIDNELIRQDFWGKNASLGQSYQLTYSKYFSSQSPIAFVVGVGMSKYSFYAEIPYMEESLKGIMDPDGDMLDIYYQYNDINENVSLSYLNIPLEFHIGNNTIQKGIQPWINAGVLLSINMKSDVSGSGQYTTVGYYPEWDMTVRDVEQLGLRSNADVYNEFTKWDLNKMVLWGTVSMGVCIPISKSNWELNAGAKCSYSLNAISNETGEQTNTQYRLGINNLLGGKGARILNWGLALGITYNFHSNK